eukprot:TRINITY_DN1812_c0_g1_i14.p1 TRINITY_DN1812_c0_g1~~TRINITY_DN1812_c0_g1_i14.p1  ORF type:complete len:349 (+),score=89.56 TRINITY_DN1812_c0_g1_i14:76-1122(+)
MCIRDRYNSTTPNGIRIENLKKLTIIRRLESNPSESSPLPGSLEEDCEFPDKYLELETLPSCSPRNYAKFSLKAVDVFNSKSEAALNRKKAEIPSPQSTAVRRVLVKKLSFSSGVLFSSKENVKKYTQTPQGTHDFIIMEHYKEIEKRFGDPGFYITSQFADSLLDRAYTKNRQDRFFATFSEEEKHLKDYYKTIDGSMGRKPHESLLARANGYREKMELAQAMEMATPTAIIYGSQNWHLSLRNSPNLKDTAHYTLPLDRSHVGLWVHITENPNNQVVVIRKPGPQIKRFKTYVDNPFVKVKQVREYKRVKELLPVIGNQEISNLFVSVCVEVGGWEERVQGGTGRV